MKTNFKWEEQTFYVTKCCGSFNWAETNLGTACYQCKQVIPNNLRLATDNDDILKLSK